MKQWAHALVQGRGGKICQRWKRKRRILVLSKAHLFFGHHQKIIFPSSLPMLCSLQCEIFGIHSVRDIKLKTCQRVSDNAKLPDGRYQLSSQFPALSSGFRSPCEGLCLVSLSQLIFKLAPLNFRLRSRVALSRLDKFCLL